MNRFFNHLLVWLLVALLPLQAVAGSFGMTCAPVQQQSGQDVQVHGVAADDAHAGHHGGHASQAASDSVSVSEQSSGHHDGKLSHSSCSTCSAFCVGAVAPPSSLLPSPTFDGSNAVVVAPPSLTVAFIQDGPQRPPRR